LILTAILVWYIYRKLSWYIGKVTFQGKTILITGASSGIGEELAKQMSRKGAKKIIIAARRMEELERVKKTCSNPSIIQCVKLDLNKPRECLDLQNQLKLSDLDILINNGGVSLRKPFIDTDFDSAETLMNTNFMSHIALVKAFMPLLEKAKGHIVNVSSEAGLVGSGCRTSYCASKFAINGFSKSLRSEVKHKGVKVCMIYPGYIQTNIAVNALVGQKDKRLGKTD